MKENILNRILIEWNNSGIEDNGIIKSSNVKNEFEDVFVYRLDKPGQIRVFNPSYFPVTWLENYLDKVYIVINGELWFTPLTSAGFTQSEFQPGIYKIVIKDLQRDMKNNGSRKSTEYMFLGCDQLVSVPMLDTKNITYMSCMFYNCPKLETVPLFNTQNVSTMDSMFYDCPNLSEETKKAWRHVYDFKTHNIKTHNKKR